MAREGGQEGAGEMHSRRIRLEDGRYLVFYTFGGEAPEGAEGERATKDEPRPANVAEEERRV